MLTSDALHDIGYIELPPHLLEKAEFEAGDRELVKNHPILARDLLSLFSELKEIATIILYHHERWDGSGYPQGLSGVRIPLESRIIAASEAYDSLISGRSHRTKKNVQEAKKFEVSIEYWRKILMLENCYDDAYQGLMLCYVAGSNTSEAPPQTDEPVV